VYVCERTSWHYSVSLHYGAQEWVRRGHGEYREILGEREFFAEMKGEERMVCHFYRENWPCKVRHACPLLALLADFTSYKTASELCKH
jgi:hypothetical protein